jgi:hypothetical protein
MSISELKLQIVPILKKSGVKRSSLFGSFARGEQKVGSDVDVLVEMPRGANLLDLVQLKFDLEESLDRDVDVLTYDSLHPSLKSSIQKDAVSIF